MTRRLAILLAVALVAFATGRASATPPSAPDPAPSWTPIMPTMTEAPQPSDYPQAALPSAVTGGASPEPVADEDSPLPSVGTSPAPSSPARTVGPSAVPPGSANPPLTVTGLASWYCLPGRSACTKGYPASGLYAAAGPALRVGAWRGRYVTVTANGRSVRVRLSDWCACPARIVDLYASVVGALGLPLSRGIYTVRVTW